AADQHAGRGVAEQPAELGDHVQAAPLVADAADGAGAAPRLDDRRTVAGGACTPGGVHTNTASNSVPSISAQSIKGVAPVRSASADARAASVSHIAATLTPSRRSSTSTCRRAIAPAPIRPILTTAPGTA